MPAPPILTRLDGLTLFSRQKRFQLTMKKACAREKKGLRS
ncbi:hypothetical protein GCWU000325_00354 [Alloprevotella tannerae ATCC 51259]|uniref:Uncharacterized protein n=1 Tax=Alloprevotella tannerae ATCC 51259 TaxID=626522 RepID=C9LDT2_9BACT|nr:hypothetical protein GCWU000325_00354 [Alloprevotella tannerae ATCC 51259]